MHMMVFNQLEEQEPFVRTVLYGIAKLVLRPGN